MSPVDQSALHDNLAEHGLAANGTVSPDDGGTIVLLSPSAGFWDIFTASLEYGDGAADPMDRWSARIVSAIAAQLGAHPLFPFGDEPAPFFRWAQESGRAWQSPVQLLVGSDMGLNVSYRGGLRFKERFSLVEETRPCETCAQLCTSACPVSALTADGYDVAACKAYLASTLDAPCLEHGCAVRRSCPVSRLQTPAHAQFHMEAFLR
ncbi:MAG: ferredoxin [Rhodobacteraceae bacterium]|nr:ferredoxin [Paracoccaceae bacterium]